MQIGDIIKVPLGEDKNAYIQYIHSDRKWGNLIQPYSLITTGYGKTEIKKIKNSNPLTPPLFTDIKLGLDKHNWKIIGNTKSKISKSPHFLFGAPGYWIVWDGEKETPIGANVPQQYRNLEYLQLYSPELIAERIKTGIKPNDYLIHFDINKKIVPKLGDIIEIPLKYNKKSFAQYMLDDKNNFAAIIKVFDLVKPTSEIIDINEIIHAKSLFNPIHINLIGALNYEKNYQRENWEIIGNNIVDNSKYPLFVIKRAGEWVLRKENNIELLGRELPGKYRNLELSKIYMPIEIVERIEKLKKNSFIIEIKT